MQPKVLIVDDEPAIRDMLAFALQRAKMQASTAASATEALIKISEQRPDILLIDWMMPKISGIELIRRLRKDEVTGGLPIIMLTARVSEDDRIHGLEVGADDYIIKPFSPRELIARIKALLRRSQPVDEQGFISYGTLRLDTNSRRVWCGDQAIKLGPTEYRLLEFLITHPERAYSRAQILDHVWGTNTFLEERTVDVHVRRLRKALEPTGNHHYIQTVRSHGYRFSTEL